MIREVKPEGEILDELIRLSGVWEEEHNCRGYRKNGHEDLAGRRAFIYEDGGRIAGYLFGLLERTEKPSTVAEAGKLYFEIEELYGVPELRSRGIGRALFAFAENAVKNDTDLIMLSTAATDAKRILHFYIDELGMEFWNARLFKRI